MYVQVHAYMCWKHVDMFAYNNINNNNNNNNNDNNNNNMIDSQKKT